MSGKLSCDGGLLERGGGKNSTVILLVQAKSGLLDDVGQNSVIVEVVGSFVRCRCGTERFLVTFELEFFVILSFRILDSVFVCTGWFFRTWWV